MLTSDHLVKSGPHPSIGGEQRIYRFADGHGLSLINSPMAHAYPFAWEAGVLKNVKPDGSFDGLTYDTPLSQDVEVFDTDEEANDFIHRAAEHFGAAEAIKP
jgi:hypothetical protein